MEAEPGLEPTLRNILDQHSLKWIFVGGKGGVGKTTCSCSLAVLLSAVRSNVLIISTDPAHNLSDAFRQKFTRSPTLVDGFTNLFAMEVDPNPEEGDSSALADEGGMSSFLGDLAGSIPGIDEAMSFAEVMRQVQTMDYAAIVFDTAPTGHTLRLLQFPTMLQKGLEKLSSLKGTIGSSLGQIASLLGVNMEDAQNQVMGRMEGLKQVVEEVNTQFRDPDLTTFVCVCIPEFLSLYETERLVQELARFDIDTHNIVINQVMFPEDIGTSRLLQARMKMQQGYVSQYEELYEDFHIIKLPLLEAEVRGADALRSFSQYMVQAYSPQERASPDEFKRIEELEGQIAQLRVENARLHAQLARAGPQP